MRRSSRGSRRVGSTARHTPCARSVLYRDAEVVEKPSDAALEAAAVAQDGTVGGE
ncbi:hypothetical protein HLK59_21420 [Streptomyces sp. S3(2020)]|nr:hypothetical protein [Streptomyces sp. S3(2020)]